MLARALVARSGISRTANRVLGNAEHGGLGGLGTFRMSWRWLHADMIRNVAIVAHVDHGKTTLVDSLLRQSGSSVSERVMDSNPLERERGITILAKCTSIDWKGVHINIVDTPGHADFGGEVERILSMVDGVVLVVDVNEGVMAQTKFVMSKAIAAKLRPIVVFNKVDRCDDPHRANAVIGEVFDAFCNYGADDSQLEFPVVYCSARARWAANALDDERIDMAPLLDTILKHVPPPEIEEGPFRMLVTMMEPNVHFGTVVTGRVLSGSVKPNQRLQSLNLEGNVVDDGRILRIMARQGGMDYVVLEEATGGQIVSLAGLSKTKVSCTVCDPSVTTPLTTVPIDPPTISMTFQPNTSPFAGKEGKLLTGSQILERLLKEATSNVSITVKPISSDAFEVCGRGPLQLGILIENMRREGFELCISPPKVLLKDVNGAPHEPIEELTLEIDDSDSGPLIEKITLRKGELLEYKQNHGRTTLRFLIPARGLLGLQHQFLMDTHGTGVMHHLYHSHKPYAGDLGQTRKGVLISTATGLTTDYSLNTIEPRGVLFVSNSVPVYAGMIIGEHAKSGDLEVNPTRAKKLTNIRAAGADEKIRLSPPRLMTLEEAIGFIQGDEQLEVTPSSVRLRRINTK